MVLRPPPRAGGMADPRRHARGLAGRTRLRQSRLDASVRRQVIVSTADNFGKMGSLPTHPELLEYLAGEFIRNGWSTKKLIREMMLSRAYQQSSLAADFPKTAGLADPQTSRSRQRAALAHAAAASRIGSDSRLDARRQRQAEREDRAARRCPRSPRTMAW